jgi:SAM-dependent methyltransferase
MMDVKTSVQAQFGNTAAAYSTSAVHSAGKDLQIMIDAAHLTGTEQVLDVGCGAGHTALTFAPHVKTVIAFDITAAMLDQVNRLSHERGIENIQTWLGDVEQLPFDDHSFDIVTSRYCAHHWPHPQQAVREIFRVLKPGGRFLLDDVIGYPDPAQDTFLQAIELLRDQSHVRDHSTKEWHEMLTEAGFAAQLTATWPISLDFQDWVTRMQTPADNVAILKKLFDTASTESRQALAITANYAFSITGALFDAVR